ncbi:MAG: fibronectin type III domain-containing protein, partial [Acidobacteriota bacterium]
TGEFVLYQTLGAGATAFQDVGLDEGETYSYRLAAFNSSGESTPFAEASVTMPVLPGIPSLSPVTRLTSTSLKLDWTEGGGVETGVKVFRRVGSSGNFTLLTTLPANTLTFTDTGLTQNTSYSYYLVAFNQGGDSEPSQVGSATTPIVPPAPTLTSVNVTSYNSITVNWSYLSPGQADHSGFILQRSTNLNGPYTNVYTASSPTETSRVDTGLVSRRF